MEIINKLKEVAELLYNITGLPISFLKADGSLIFIRHAKDAIYVNKCEKENMIQLFQEETHFTIPIIRKMVCENYIGIKINQEIGIEGILILGPSIYFTVPDQIVDSLNCKLSMEQKGQILSYYREIPIVPFSKLNHFATLAFYMIYQKTVEVEEVVAHNFFQDQTIDSVWEKYNESFSIARQDANFYPSYKLEKLMFECIKKGEEKMLLGYLNKHIEETSGSLAGKDPIRANKNLVVGYSAIACRIAIEAGNPSELMYRKNDIYVQLVEEANTVEAIQSLLITILCDYAKMVNKIKRKEYSNAVKSCIDYIYMHLYEEVSVKQMGNNLNFNENYLSRIFKDEVGKTISEFITHEKIEEAKRLLILTDFTIIYISVVLHFHDQSHFTRVFKKETGMTPKKYRDRYVAHRI